MSNHPLNLQLQLVPPSARETQRVVSASRSGTMDSQMTDSTRQRSPSVRSNRSNTSLYSSASFSTASIASSTTSTSTASARRIIPLYNLSAHNVMTNTVTDAGTDAKIAKFGKRCIEIIGLGMLECYEVLGVQLDPATLALYLPYNGAPGPSMLPPIEAPSSRSSSRPPSTVTPSSSNSHLPSELQHPTVSTPTAPSFSQQSTQTPSTPTANSAKKLFGKMFKRKDAASSPATTPTPTPTGFPEPPITPTPITPSASSTFFNRPSKRNSALSATSATAPDLAHGKVASSSSAQDLSAGTAGGPTAAGSLQPPCLGTQATLLYRTKSRSTVIAPSVIANLSGNVLALRKSRSKGSFQETSPQQQLQQLQPATAARSREPSNGAHLQVEHLSPPGQAEIHLEGSSSTLGLAGPPPAFKRTGHSYEWVIRRWIKGSDTGLFGIKESLLSARSAVFDIPASGGAREGIVEVRFEWVKGKGSKERAKAKERSDRLGVDGDGRRSRPRSMISDTAEAFVAEPAGSSALRPSSMYVSGTAPVTPEKRRAAAASTTTSPQSDFRSPSPGVRPSMESLRRSSDGSGEHPTSSAGHGNEASGTVYKGGRPAARRPSMKERDRGARMVADDATDEDSDPEDSETPWTCTLHVGPPVQSAILQAPTDPTAPLTLTGTRTSISGSRSTGAIGSGPIPPPDFTGGGAALHKRISTSSSSHFPAAGGSSSTTVQRKSSIPPTGQHFKFSTEGAPPRMEVADETAAAAAPKAYRLKLATMTPAPHHPKVVSQLRMPYPLPDVNVDKMRVSTGDEEEEKGDLILTMEDIKDVVCVTGLWLIVREGFGGLERRRKGDGWKIRG
ncbi:hypothetical protein FRC05_000848 [Tulasnella sp. 425]|nr:hypothetical protein FRC05_000848 [Tulasnella sp. 425]